MNNIEIDYFKKAIDKLPGKLILKTDVLITSVGQKYLLVVNKNIYYELRLFIEKDSRLNCLDFFIDPQRSGVVPRVLDYLLFADISTYLKPLWVHQFFDYYDANSAIEKLEAIKLNLSALPPIFIESDLSSSVFLNGKFYKINSIQIPFNPEFYFRPGDHIQVSRGLLNRSGIYIGNSNVVCVSHSNGNNETSQVTIVEENWSKFSVGYTEFYVFIPNFKVMSDEQIIKIAKSFVGNHEGFSENIDNIVQHFETLCQVGHDIFSKLNKKQMKFRNDLFKSIIL